jgi:hypothetical protein
MEGAPMPVCPSTGLTVPECSCAHCLTDQIRRHQPELLEADPVGEIRVTRTAHRPRGENPERRAA